MSVQHTICDEAVRFSFLKEQIWNLPKLSGGMLGADQSAHAVF